MPEQNESASSMTNVLIIDDENQIRKFLDIALRAQGYKTLLAENGQKGLELLALQGADMRSLEIRQILDNDAAPKGFQDTAIYVARHLDEILQKTEEYRQRRNESALFATISMCRAIAGAMAQMTADESTALQGKKQESNSNISKFTKRKKVKHQNYLQY